ncbi:MAG: AAA domain-containing protein, partial [Pirellulaceae bacterium]|nr:AAA domain-containing protein [Pirellulaceae bacterium]
DLVVIDEACQSVEPGCWIPLLRCDRVILAGDHCQLPPTILSREASEAGLKTSLMERVINLYGSEVTRMLEVQYRMHDHIMNFSAQQFYDEKLVGDASVISHLLCDLPDVVASELTSNPVLFIDTAGAGWEEEIEPEGLSRMNVREAELILKYTQELVAAGLSPKQIAVIAPYAAQARFLRRQNTLQDLEIDTVDGFQGREKEAVLISLVRSNPKGEVGFLAETRRMNVALTRARRKLIVVGDSATVGGHPFFSDLIDYVQSIDAYRSVWEIADIE